LREASYAKYFCGAFASRAIDGDVKSDAHARDFCLRAAFATESRRCKKSLFHRAFCDAHDMRSQRRCAFAQRNVAFNERVIDSA